MGLPGYLIRSLPSFRASAAVTVQRAAFATGVLPDIYAFHRYTGNSAPSSCTQAEVLCAGPRLSRGFSHLTFSATYTPFTPSDSGQRSPPTCYRGCWHVVSRAVVMPVSCIYSSYIQRSSLITELYNSKAFFAHAASLRQGSPHCAIFPLLPPVGVWACLSPSVADRPLDRLPIVALVSRYLTN